jgi:hypothetical protein
VGHRFIAVSLFASVACASGTSPPDTGWVDALGTHGDAADDGSTGDDALDDEGSESTSAGEESGAPEETTGGAGGPTMTKLLPGRASTAACFQAPAGETVEMAMDRDPSTKFHARGSSVWLRVDTEGPYVLSAYAITSAADAPERDPVRWLLLASNDGATWTELDVRLRETFADRLERRDFAVEADEHHRYYMLRMENAAGGDLQIGELQLYGRTALHDDSTEPPSPARSLTAFAASRTRIDLSWQSGAHSLHRIERSSDGQTFEPIGYASGHATSYSVHGMQPGASASFRVVAQNGSGTAAPSNVASATTPPVIGLPAVDGWVYAENGYSLTVGYALSPLPQATYDRLIDEYFTVYPQMASAYHPGAVADVRLTFDPTYDGVAAAGGSDITISSTYAAAHPEDLDVIAHEGFHIVQAYTSGNVPGWATEGLADYARRAYGNLNSDACWSFQRYEPGQHYTDGYGVTARFLLWVDAELAAGLPERLDETLRAGTYSDAFWVAETGRSIDALWAAYADEPEHFPVSYD